MGLNHRRMNEPVNEYYTLGEEIAHSVTHGIGAALSLAALVTLLVLAIIHGTKWHILSFAVYGVSLFAVYLASTLYHGVQKPRLRPILRKVDHACIYLLIAGTYTPFVLISMRSSLGLTLLTAVWAMAVFGIVYKIFFIDHFAVLTTLIYVAMGWMSMFAWREMVANIPQTGLVLLVAGGGLYTVGVIFYAMTKIRYTHAVWHLFILGASACHFVAVLTLLNAA
ncbi:MAG TPA: hemolysin III family protein [Promineifilum sp.]|nr:hemolysin III family protein [Promineifilum sp.]